VLRGWRGAAKALPATLQARREVQASAKDPRALDAVMTRVIRR
jgi:hypothetical protein